MCCAFGSVANISGVSLMVVFMDDIVTLAMYFCWHVFDRAFDNAAFEICL